MHFQTVKKQPTTKKVRAVAAVLSVLLTGLLTGLVSSDVEAKSGTGQVVGVLEIPSIKLRTSVRLGTSRATLAKDPGVWEQTGPIGGSKGTTITGHRSSYGAEFANFDKLKRGNQIVVKINKRVYLYRITSKKVVKPREVSVMNAREPYELTLITCHPKRSNRQRLVVRASLVQITTLMPTGKSKSS